VKFLERIPGTRTRFYQFTAIADCTRVRVLKIFNACNPRTAIQFMDDVVRRLPFRIHVVQTDNGAEFQSRFHWHLERLDIGHVYIRPRTPHLNGKVERIGSMTRSFTSSMTSCGSGRTTTTTIARMARWTARRPTSDSSRGRELKCHQVLGPYISKIDRPRPGRASALSPIGLRWTTDRRCARWDAAVDRWFRAC
jgi:transposase InsO family protein